MSADWFPLGKLFNDTYWLDCSGPREGPTPVQLRYLWEYNPPDELRRQRIGSVAEAADTWTALLERGLWDFDPQSGIYDWVREPGPGLPRYWLGIPPIPPQ